MKILAIGDLHYKKDNAPDTLKLTERILEEISKQQPHMVVFLGDSLDRFEDIKMDPQRRVINLFRRTRRLLLEIHQEIEPLMVILIGNHDRPSPQGYQNHDHPFTALEEWSHTLVVSKPLKLKYMGVSMALMPYIPPGGFIEALDTASFPDEFDVQLGNLIESGYLREYSESWETVEIIFGHQELTGVDFNGRASNAENWPNDAPLLVNGHIHAHSYVKSNFLCLGAPIQHEYEDNPKRYFGLFDLPERSVKEGTHTRELPEHTLIPVNVTNKTRIDIHIDDLDDFECPEGQLKIVISGPRGTESSYSNDSRIKRWRAQGIIVRFVEVKTAPINIQLRNPTGKVLPYLERLKKAVQKDPKQLEFYREIFEPQKSNSSNRKVRS
jgi:predicted phosphodiesterase